MKRDKQNASLRPDLSRLVMLDYSPTEGAMLIGILEGVKRTRGEQLGVPILDLIDGTCAHIRLQLKGLNWPQEHNRTPYPV